MRILASVLVWTTSTTLLMVATTALDSVKKMAVDGLGNVVGASAAAAAAQFDEQPPADSVPKPSAAEHSAQKSRRMAERRQRVKEAIANLPREPDSQLQRMSPEELEKAFRAAEERADGRFGANNNNKMVQEQQELIRRAKDDMENANEEERKLWGSSSGNDPYEAAGGLMAETDYYDKWQQAYRFLGGYVDCSSSWGGNSHDSGNNNNQQEEGEGCSRWMMWAAYVDPNYAGGGYDEYFGDDAPGALDCHSPDSSWKLIGVYRQEFYQYIEQISKHLWAIDEYEYIVALAGLEYMTDYECYGVGYDEYGQQLYAEVQPIEGGAFQMGLYSDEKCIELNTETSYTYDDFAEQSELDLGSKDATDDDAFHQEAYEYWQDTQEYTLTNLNTVYDDFRFCTSCVDYPTYQDGYFIGDDGTDDDDLINQCWKFYSHDSFNCDADCIAMGAEQGTITWISYNGKQFGTLIEGQYSTSHESTGLGESENVQSSGTDRLERLKANLFMTFAGIVFVATFLAFAVARGSSKKKKKSRSSRSRRLLDDDDRRRSSRSASRKQSGKSVRSSRSKSKSQRSSSKSVKSSRSKSRSRRSSGDREYDPPRSSEKKRSQSRSRKSSRSSSANRNEEE